MLIRNKLILVGFWLFICYLVIVILELRILNLEYNGYCEVKLLIMIYFKIYLNIVEMLIYVLNRFNYIYY